MDVVVDIIFHSGAPGKVKVCLANFILVSEKKSSVPAVFWANKDRILSEKCVVHCIQESELQKRCLGRTAVSVLLMSRVVRRGLQRRFLPN